MSPESGHHSTRKAHGFSPAQAEAMEAMLRNEADLAFKRRVPMILRYLDPQSDDRILDCGCGMGFNVRALSLLFQCQVTGVDRNPASLSYARRALGAASARVVRGDVLQLPFRPDAFNKILMTEVLEHLPDDAAALQVVRRVLAGNGRLVVSVPDANYPFWWDPANKLLESWFGKHVPSDIWWAAGIWADHLRLYSPQDLRRLLESNGFAVDDLVEHTHYCLPFHHFLVYGVGKNLIQRGLLPGSLAQAADRFRGEENRGSRLNPMNLVHNLLRWVDRHNEGLGDPALTYVDIVASARKIE